MRSVIISALIIGVLQSPAYAGFQRWSAQIEKDPFSGGQSVVVNFMSSIRSGVFIVCDSAKAGVIVRAVPGFAYDPSLQSVTPKMQFAIDGELLLESYGATASVGDNIAAAQTLLTGDQAQKFVDAFAKAQDQIAVKDGIGEMPQLLTARGSTMAGEALVACMAMQPK